MIEIIVDKVFIDGYNEGRKVKEIRALTYNQLPKAYLQKENSIYLKEGKLFINLMGVFWIFMKEGEVYEENCFQDKLSMLKEAREMLKEINETVREKEKNWYGEETFII